MIQEVLYSKKTLRRFSLIKDWLINLLLAIFPAAIISLFFTAVKRGFEYGVLLVILLFITALIIEALRKKTAKKIKELIGETGLYFVRKISRRATQGVVILCVPLSVLIVIKEFSSVGAPLVYFFLFVAIYFFLYGLILGQITYFIVYFALLLIKLIRKKIK